LSHSFIGLDLVADAEKVVQNLAVIEKEVQTAAGQWYEMQCLPYRTLENKIDGVVFTFTDVTRLKHSEQAMMEARDYAENIINTTRESLLVLDPQLKVVSANRAFHETFQVSPEETENRLIYELKNRQWDIPRLRELLEKILRHDSDFENFEVELEFPAVGPKVMSLNVRRIYDRERTSVRLILLAIRDLPESERAAEERKRLEEQLRQAQKMESMGTLAAGIAHDFNNILNIIQGYAFVLRGHAAKNDEIADSLNVINDTTKRGAALVRQLLTLARKTEPKLELTNINTVIEELTKLIRETFPKTIQVALELNRELPPVMADPNEIPQALLNLCVNGRDAMPDGGKLLLRTETLDRMSLREYGEAKAERYVCIEVSDTGIGMDESIQNRIFEPFFTTKESRGTGLGLAVVYGIVKNHNGFIQVESTPMHGATFRLYFPVAPSGE
jgi:signal transduction histidine kinase